MLLSMFVHYLHLVAPQIHSMAAAMSGLSFVMFGVTGLFSVSQTLLNKEPAKTWQFFFSCLVTFGALWALVPA